MKEEAQKRKDTPVYSGFMKYFPLAMQEVARCSKAGNDQHNPGMPLHWDRSKSGDELDALSRHLLDAGTIDTDGIRHSAKVAWRAMANLEKELETAEVREPNIRRFFDCVSGETFVCSGGGAQLDACLKSLARGNCFEVNEKELTYLSTKREGCVLKVVERGDEYWPEYGGLYESFASGYRWVRMNTSSEASE